MTDISFIVSAYNRPDYLRCCLASLAVQKGVEAEIVVSHPINEGAHIIRAVADYFGAKYRRVSDERAMTGYHDPGRVGGKWLCFPTEDSYYVPFFSRFMIDFAERDHLDFVYCDMLYDPRYAYAVRGECNCYSVMEVTPSLGGIDKTCFLVTQRAFHEVGGWPYHKQDWRDGAFAEKVVKRGFRHGKAPGVMVVKN